MIIFSIFLLHIQNDYNFAFPFALVFLFNACSDFLFNLNVLYTPLRTSGGFRGFRGFEALGLWVFEVR